MKNMTNKIKILMTISIIKYYLLKYILPIYFLIQIINTIGDENFYQSVIKYSAYIIISLIVNRLLVLEIFLSKQERDWIEKEINKLL